jgi:hypothetical protein
MPTTRLCLVLALRSALAELSSKANRKVSILTYALVERRTRNSFCLLINKIN